MVEALNAAKLDYATFGNHEFELPRDTLIARIAESIVQVALDQLHPGRREPLSQGPAVGHRAGVRAPGRDLRADPRGGLPELRALHQPRQRGDRSRSTP